LTEKKFPPPLYSHSASSDFADVIGSLTVAPTSAAVRTHGSTFAADFAPPLVDALEPPEVAPEAVPEAEHPTSPRTSVEARRVVVATTIGSRRERVFVITEFN
jgi:hypothetical protein